jgi:group I intron endonuclease
MENKVYGRIYKITNLVNGKSYIGQTIRSLEVRLKKHYYYSSKSKNNRMIITRAIKKHGKENFTIEEVDVAYSQKELNLLEGVYISWFNTLTPNGYNLTNIINGKGTLSEETKEKLRKEANKTERLKWSSENGIKNRGRSGAKNVSSKYIGVCKSKKFILSTIKYNKKRIHLGHYKSESDAAKAYDIAAIKYFGHDCILNFPELREDYIKGNIIVNKTCRKDYSKSGINGITFDSSCQRYRFKWYDTKEKRNRYKSSKDLEEIIKFKAELIN